MVVDGGTVKLTDGVIIFTTLVVTPPRLIGHEAVTMIVSGAVDRDISGVTDIVVIPVSYPKIESIL